MRKNFKRRAALLLAVFMAASTCLFSHDCVLAAAEGEEKTVENIEDSSAVLDGMPGTDTADPEQGGIDPAEDTQEIVIPKQPEEDEKQTVDVEPAEEPGPADVQEEDTADINVKEENEAEKTDIAQGDDSEEADENPQNTKNIITFDLNGGSGIIPAEIEAELHTSIRLPDGNGIEREDYILLGWSESKDSSGISTDNIKDNAAVFSPGSGYYVTGDAVFYAVWARSAGQHMAKIKMAIREDGKIPNEPSLQYAPYITVYDSSPEQVDILQYVNPAHTVVGEAAVNDVLTDYFYEFVDSQNNSHHYWDNASEEVVWYVVKDQRNDNTWHIDGTIRKKENIYLDYDGNGADNSFVPTGREIKSGSPAAVGWAGNYAVSGKEETWVDLVRNGYEFEKWNTAPDGTGDSYAPGDTICIKENTTLYAIWKPKNNTSLTVTKTAARQTGGRPGLGDAIDYTVIVKNTGNITLTDIDVADSLVALEDSHIHELAPGEEKQYAYSYIVKKSDILNGEVVNKASARTKGGITDEAEVVTDVEDMNPGLINAAYSVNKRIVNPQEQYKVGHTIQYEITVASAAGITNAALENIVVTDELTGAAGEVTFKSLPEGTALNDDNTVTIERLAQGDAVTLECEYVITRADAGSSIVNTAIADPDFVISADPENQIPVDPGDKEDSTEPVQIENIYKLIIHYVYVNGGVAAPDVTGQYLAGESFSYTSPAIAGYTPSIGLLRSDVQGMPAQDVELTIVYTADTPSGVIPAVPEVPAPAPAAAPAGLAAALAPAPAPPFAAPAAAAVPDAPVPAAAVVVDEEGRINILPVLDEEVPLTNRELDVHHCCNLHFILMLTALVVYMCYTKSMKKQQKRIAGLRDELETESLKRRLGLADDKENQS